MPDEKCAIYIRVSLDMNCEDRRFQDTENQLRPLQNWAKALNLEIAGIYEDKVSGADSNRPSFIRMRMDAHQCKFKTILVWSLDRFSREGILSTLSYIKELRGFGVGVKSLQDSWLDTSLDSQFAELILSVLAWAAQQERVRISERTKAGIQRRKNLKQWHGGRPKGSRDRKPRKQRGGRLLKHY